MSVLHRLSTGFRLAGQSASVLRKNPGLTVYPLVGGLAMAVFVLTAVGGFVAVGGLVLAAGILAGYTLGAIAKVALYTFARDEATPAEFDDAIFESASR